MQRENEVQHVFLVGAKSLGAYGGFLTELSDSIFVRFELSFLVAATCGHAPILLSQMDLISSRYGIYSSHKLIWTIKEHPCFLTNNTFSKNVSTKFRRFNSK